MKPTEPRILHGGIVHPYVPRPDGSWSGESDPVVLPAPGPLLPSVVGLSVLLAVGLLVLLAVAVGA